MSDPEDDRDFLEEIKALEDVLANKESSDSSAVENSAVASNLVVARRADVPSRGFGEVEPQQDDIDSNDSSNTLTAYETNKQLIELLQEARRELLAILEQCLENKAIVNEKIRTRANNAKSSAKVLICSAGMPYFKDRKHYPAPWNDDVKAKMKNGELQVVQLRCTCPWTAKDRNILWRAIRQEAACAVLERARLDDARSSKANANRDNETQAENGEVVFAEGSDIEPVATSFDLPKNFRAMVGSLGTKEFDWLKIAASDFDNRHTAEECRVMWRVFLHPDINRCKWTKAEDSDILRLREKYNAENWEEIARELNNRRSGYQCFIRYNSIASTSAKDEKTWSKTEDDRLRLCVEKYKIGHYIPWGTVGRYMAGRSKGQVYYRWMFHIAPHLKKGRFTEAEDNTLLAAVEKYGKNFSKISSCVVTNRSSVQLSERHETLTMKRRGVRNVWSIKEDARLLVLYNTCGANWSSIAQKMPGKTRTQVRQRYNAIIRYWDRGISLYEIPRNYRDNRRSLVRNNEEEATVEDITMIGRFEKIRAKSLNEMELVDLEFVKYFQYLPEPSKPGRKRKFYGKDELEDRTRKLHTMLNCFGAKLAIPDEFDDPNLTEKDKQLLKSLKDYQQSQHERVKAPPRYAEYGGESDSGERHYAPICSGDCNAQQKIRWHDNIDYELPSSPDRCRITLDLRFDTPKIIVDSIGEDENETFDKLSGIMISREIRTRRPNIVERVYVLGPKESAKILSSIDIESFPSHSADIAQSNRITNNRRRRGTKKEVTCNSNMHEGIIQCLDQPIGYIEPKYCTLLALKNITSRLKTTSESDLPLQGFPMSDKGKISMAIFEKRFVQLFKYSIGLSNIVRSDMCIGETTESTKCPAETVEESAGTSSTLSSPSTKKRRH